MRAVLQRIVVRGFSLLRDAWVVAGVTLALILLLELGYRAQAWVRSDAPPMRTSLLPGPPSAFDTVPWAREYLADHEKEERVLWEPFVYVRNPTFRGTQMNVDSAGHRVVPGPALKAPRRLRVFFLGGSTAFGWFQRDAYTLPSLTAARLREIVPANVDVDLTNFGTPGHTFTQEVVMLMLRLRNGERPDVVVFYDGINDVSSVIQRGIGGEPQNETRRSADFERGRAAIEDAATGWRNDLRALARLSAGVLARSELAKRISAGRDSTAPLVPADSATARLVSAYVGNVQVVEGLAKAFGFDVIYVWQPAFLSTTKPLTTREQWFAEAGRVGSTNLMREIHIAAPAQLQRAVRPLVGERFVDGTPLFAKDSTEIYADVFGHTFEWANPTIVDAFWPPLSAATKRALARRSAGNR
ncbi:MAG TPA: SGNH/GDSL hydrolase family protein [Gemmatimonadaceae bacterium]|nr:SGNH/GDSL hydrolase family protein [Gemmatimonadaceae bacterium]